MASKNPIAGMNTLEREAYFERLKSLGPPTIIKRKHVTVLETNADRQQVFIEIVDELGRSMYSPNKFESYNINRNYEWIADTFSCTLTDETTIIKTGYYMNFWIEGVREFMGIIETINRSITKSGTKTTISGRSRASILVSSYIYDSFADYPGDANPNILPYEIVEELIKKNTDFLTGRKRVMTIYDPMMNSDQRGKLSRAVDGQVQLQFLLTSWQGSKLFFSPEFKAMKQRRLKVSPGMTVWAAISKLMQGTGFQIMYQNQNLMFCKLEKYRSLDIDGKALTDYSIVMKAPPSTEQTATAVNLKDSIVGRYSQIIVLTQTDGATQYLDASHYTDNSGTATDETLLRTKTFVQIFTGGTKKDGDELTDVEKIAVKIRDDQRFKGFQVTYTIPGHIAPNGEPWRLNRYVNVDDELNDINGKYVIFGVSYKFSSASGTSTDVLVSYSRNDDIENLTE